MNKLSRTQQRIRAVGPQRSLRSAFQSFAAIADLSAPVVQRTTLYVKSQNLERKNKGEDQWHQFLMN